MRPHVLLALALAFALVFAPSEPAVAQELRLPSAASTDSAALHRAMPTLAREVMKRYRATDPDTHLNTVFRLQLVAGDEAEALKTLATLRALRGESDPRFAPSEYTQYELYARAKVRAAGGDSASFTRSVREQFLALEARLSDVVAYRVHGSLQFFDLAASGAQLERMVATYSAARSPTLDDAVALCRAFFVHRVYQALLLLMPPLLSEAEGRRYQIDETVRVPMRDGNVLSAIVVRPRRLVGPQPTVLELTIYANGQNRATAMEAAAHGFVGIVATSRGKRSSAGPVIPWESEAADAFDLLAWISRQSWSNGSVGMSGGSYAGFTQWAATKQLHPALRTIVPAAAVAPGIDFPRENGVVLNFQYSWAHYVGRDSLLDIASYRDGARWDRLDSTWFARGSAYRELDALDGVPNPLFRRWLDHPTFDAYWQAMMPTGGELASLSIPVLTITGYFDGAQPGALHYFREHVAHRPSADHTLLIGPWDHFGAQRRPSPVLGDLRIDPAANVDIIGTVYEWMEHVLRAGPRPRLLSDRVNFQVIGTNRWQHVPSLDAMSNDTISLFLSAAPAGIDHRLQRQLDRMNTGVDVIADFSNRTEVSSTFVAVGYDSLLDRSNGVAFVGEPLAEATTVSGSFSGELVATLNARDVDLGVSLYELTQAGEYIQLSYHLGRASLARDPTRRQLLTPNAREQIPLHGARLVSRVVPAGSRFVVLVNINKGPQSQLNYGSGKDPSDETIGDALTPMRLTLLPGSRLRIPVLR